MKANFYTEFVLYSLARAVSAAACRLPPRWNVRAGAAAGALLFYALPRRQALALDNLRGAFGDTYTPREYRRILLRMFRNFGRLFMEIAAIPAIDRAYVDRWVEVPPDTRDRLERHLAAGQGMIFLTGHFGNWELISITGALHGYATLVLARQQGWPRFNRLLTDYRESKGCRVVTKGFPVRELIQGLRDGRIVGILADQDGGRNGVLSPFFGRLASTAPGAIALSISTGAPVIPVFMARTAGPAHRLVLGEPLEIPGEGTVEERIQAGVDAYLRVLEAQVRSQPEQWLWLHRRWKSSPERRVLIFDDGRAGHLAQSRALAQRVEEAWRRRTVEDRRLEGRLAPLVSVRTVRVEFRHPALRALLNLVAGLSSRPPGGGDFWLRLALTPESYARFRSGHAHLSISCGSMTAAVNLLWARQIRCRPVQVLSSRFPPFGRFDLAVIPRHDLRDGERPARTLVTDGALVPLSEGSEEQRRDWSRRLGLTPGRKRIGLLLGGAAQGAALEAEQVERTVEGLLSAADRLDADLLVTTSRRTPPLVEEWLSRTLAAHPRCRLLTLVNRKEAGPLPDTRTAVPCILQLCDALAVSGDSISMVSEAAATSKPVVGFPPKAAGRMQESKYHRFLRQMERSRLLRCADAAQVGDAITEALTTGDATSGAPAVLGQSSTLRKMEEGSAELRAAGASLGGIPGRKDDPVVEFLIQWL